MMLDISLIGVVAGLVVGILLLLTQGVIGIYRFLRWLYAFRTHLTHAYSLIEALETRVKYLEDGKKK